MTNQKGIIEAISLNNKGIKIDGVWYNWLPDLNKFCETLQKGEAVEFDSDKKHLKFIRKIEQNLSANEEKVLPYKKVQKIKTLIENDYHILDDQFNMFAQNHDIFTTQIDTIKVGDDPPSFYHKLVIFYWDKGE